MGPDRQGRSYASFASFNDPDGTSWILQEIKTQLPGRVTRPALPVDVGTLAEFLRETAEHHDHYEKTHPEHEWWDWYAPYLNAREHGSTPEEASKAAGSTWKCRRCCTAMTSATSRFSQNAWSPKPVRPHRGQKKR